MLHIAKSVEYDDSENEYYIKSLSSPGEIYKVHKLIKIWACNCPSFHHNPYRDKEGCKHTRRIEVIDVMRRLGKKLFSELAIF